MNTIFKILLCLILAMPQVFVVKAFSNNIGIKFPTGYTYAEALQLYRSQSVVTLRVHGVTHNAKVLRFQDTPEGKLIIWEDLGVVQPGNASTNGTTNSQSGRSTSQPTGNGSRGAGDTQGNGWGKVSSAIGTGAAIYGTFAAIGSVIDNSRHIHNALKNNLQLSIDRHRDLSKFLRASSRQMSNNNLLELNRLGQFNIRSTESFVNTNSAGFKFDPMSDLATNCSRYSTFTDMSADYIHAVIDKNLHQVAAYASQIGSLSGGCVDIINEVLNAEGIIDLTKFDENIPLNPTSGYEFRSSESLPLTADIKRLANNYTANWYHKDAYANNPNQGLAALTGEMFLQASDQYQAVGRPDIAIEMLSFSTALYEIASGFSTGVLDSMVSNLELIPLLSDVAVETAELFKQHGHKAFEIIFDKSASFLGNIPTAIKADIIKNWDILKNGSAFEKSKVIGRLVTDRLIDKATVGSFTAIKATAKAANVNRVTKSKQHIKKMVTPSEYKSLKRGQQILDDIDLSTLEEKAARFHRLSEAADLDVDAKDYFAKRIAFEEITQEGKQYTDELFHSESMKYRQLSVAMDKVPHVSYEGNVWRGARKDIFKNVDPDAVDLFQEHEKMFLTNNRYTQPGQKGVYTTISDNLDGAKRVIASELDIQSMDLEDYLISNKAVKLDRALDLTNTVNRQILGIKDVGDITKDTYDVTHMLGDLAVKKGYQGIIAPSAALDGGKNLVIFR